MAKSITQSFKDELINSGYIHKLLKPDRSKSTEVRLFRKDVAESRLLWDSKVLKPWQISGDGGEIKLVGEALLLSSPARREMEAPMPRYTTYGNAKASLPFAGEDWQGYNRVKCRIKPECGGFHAPFLTLCLVNDGETKIPDIYWREGFHIVNLENNKWNDVVWEFPDLPRDAVCEFAFELSCYGHEIGGENEFNFYIKDIFLEQVENPDISLGWQCNNETICYSTSGYFINGEKIAVTAFTEGEFELIEPAGKTVVYKGKIARLENEKGKFGIIDFSDLDKEGYYRLKVNHITTEVFPLTENPFTEAIWKAINFIYSERCGFPVGGGHGYCHGDIIAKHGDLSLVFNGGWHDAGDLSQQTLQTAEAAYALFETALRVKNDILLYNRLIEEASWGLDFIIRTRFGDGFRATNAACLRWTDSFIGNNDDVEACVHNRSFENFLMGGVSAFAAFALTADDPDRAYIALKAAKEDYKFALERFELVGCEDGQVMEHTYNAGPAQYYAAASWCASQIYRVNSEEYYAKEAARFGELMLNCQDKGDAGLSFNGFFYRDETKKVITHFNHQSRDYIFCQALTALLETQESADNRGVWEDGLRRYGEYLKEMKSYSAPYGMQPSGVHAFNEANDAETFRYLHVHTDYQSDKDNYYKQLESGIKLNDNYCLRQFPVWFSFRGNTAVLLSLGKAASLVGRYFGDEELMDIARNQLYWNAGKNPFGQSLMYGEGNNYAQQYAVLLGETAGEMPVGIQTRENEDVPYWPMANNATYKEVWMSSVARWVLAVADFC
ncbi:MAG: glycoside hydrolase family 9 protein [Lachnospiraceae bacterium]|nr:glycoside hydrolase family 9 protein [Lachnospiraceae bacterium]